MSVVADSRRRGDSRVADVLVLILVLGLVWQAFYEMAGDVAMTPPLATIGYAVRLMLAPDFWPNVRATLDAFGLAALISACVGVPAGALLGVHRLAGDAADPVLVALYSVPKIVFYPVILLSLGLGLAPVVAFGVLNGVLPIMIFTMHAVAHVKPIYLKMGRSFGLTAWQLMQTIAFPAALPEILTGLRIGLSLTFIGTLLSEMFAAHAGVGHLLITAMQLNQVPRIMSLTLLIVVFAALLNTVVVWVEHRVYGHATDS